MNESVDPDHYKTDGVECIDAIRSMLGKEGFIAYCRGNVMRYLWRLGKKDDPSMELTKAKTYIDWILETLDDKLPSKPNK